MTGIPCENNHKHGESHSKIGFSGKYLCIDCINEIGDFDQFGPLNKPSKERDAFLSAQSKGAKVFVPEKDTKFTIVDGPNVMPQAQSFPAEKKCSMCEQILPLNVFENDKRRPDGHGPRCKACVKKRAAERKPMEVKS